MLFEKYGYRIIYDSQSQLNAKLVSILRNKMWCWKPARSEALVDIQCKLPEVHLGVIDKSILTIARNGTYISDDT
jgi:hypothetical protein